MNHLPYLGYWAPPLIDLLCFCLQILHKYLIKLINHQKIGQGDLVPIEKYQQSKLCWNYGQVWTAHI